MSNAPSHVPWPVWAAVSLMVACMGSCALVVTNMMQRRPDPPPIAGTTTAPALVTPAGMIATTPATVERGPYVPPAASGESTLFVIHNTLTRGAIRETVRVSIDGVPAGPLVVTDESPDADLEVRLPQPGRYSWTTQAQAMFVNGDGEPYVLTGSGQGIIAVEPNSRFSVNAFVAGNQWQITLERDN